MEKDYPIPSVQVQANRLVREHPIPHYEVRMEKIPVKVVNKQVTAQITPVSRPVVHTKLDIEQVNRAVKIEDF